MITRNIDAQNKYGAEFIKIGTLKNNEQECISFTSEFLTKRIHLKMVSLI